MGLYVRTDTVNAYQALLTVALSNDYCFYIYKALSFSTAEEPPESFKIDDTIQPQPRGNRVLVSVLTYFRILHSISLVPRLFPPPVFD